MLLVIIIILLGVLLFAYSLRKPYTYIILAILAILIIVPVSQIIYAKLTHDDKDTVSAILDIQTLPASIRNVECESWSWTDVLTTCYFEMDSNEFPMLLQGYKFERDTTSRMVSEEVVKKPESDFKVAEAFIHLSPGMYVKVFTNDSRRNVCIDIYIE